MLVVNFVSTECSELFAVKCVVGLACNWSCVALVELHLNCTSYLLLSYINECGDCFANWSEPKAVVYELCELLSNDVLVLHCVSVEDESFEVFVSSVQDCSAWSLVNASGLHADKTVLDDIDCADAVLAAELVELVEEANCVHLLAVETNWNTFFEIDVYICNFVWSIFWLAAENVDVLKVLVPRVLEVAAFVADVPDILVSGVNFLYCLMNRNVMSLCILDQILSGLEVPASPRSDDLDSRVESLDCSLETNLVVALACAAVADDISAFLLSDFN